MATSKSKMVFNLKHIKYEIKLLADGHGVQFSIWKMDGRFRSVARDNRKEFVASNGFIVRSDYTTELAEDAVFLWGFGNSGFDSKCFNSESDRTVYLHKLNGALKDWDKNWSGWAKVTCKHKWLTTQVVRFGVIFGDHRKCKECGKAQVRFTGKTRWEKAPEMEESE